MFSTLTKYIIKNFIKSFIVVFLCFYVIISLLELMDAVRQYFSAGYSPSVTQIMKITLCRATVTICTCFSFAVLFATVIFFTTMHNHLELNIIKGSGASPYKILRMLFVAVSILSLSYISVFDTLSVYSYRTQDISLAKPQSKGENLSVTSKGIWFRDICDNKSYIIYARNFDRITTSLNGIRVFEFDEKGNFVNTILAHSALIKDNVWYIQRCKIITRSGDTIKQDVHTLPTKLSYKTINKMVADPHSISFWKIMKLANLLEKVGLSSRSYQMHWFLRISTILQIFAFVAIAAAFLMRYNHRDRKPYVQKASALIACAFPLHFINNIILAYGENGAMPLSVSTFLVPIATLLAGILFLNET